MCRGGGENKKKCLRGGITRDRVQGVHWGAWGCGPGGKKKKRKDKTGTKRFTLKK